ncbi:MAG: GAF domain-containing protein [Alphaproteobacteria bacterium]|nr:GAF domain-containing protein [Alphaproteobacteria bacterium]
MSLVLEFLNYVEADAPRTVARLLDRFLRRCRDETAAEAGTIYVVRRRGRERVLVPTARQMGTASLRRLPTSALALNAASIAGYVARTGQVVRLADVRKVPDGRPYAHDAKLDIPGRETRSLLCLPVKNFQGEVIAVIELINRRSGRRQAPAPFTARDVERLLPVATVVAGYIERTDNLEQIQETNLKLRQRNRALAQQRAQIAALQAETEDAFKISINLLARAAEIYDEDTGNHIVRVNEYPHYLAQCIGMPKEFCDEIRYSAQLHDVGKLSIDQLHPQQRRRAVARGTPADGQASHLRASDPVPFLPTEDGGGNRTLPSREVERHRLSPPREGRGDPDLSPHRRPCRYIRRTALEAVVQTGIQPQASGRCHRQWRRANRPARAL